MQKTDVIIIGASAAGLMCAIEASKRGRKVKVLDHANKAGKKILISGGGRCNFTNYSISADNYISHNPHFCKSALNQYTQWDFIELVKQYKIAFHERSHGQLFCDDSAKNILNMLLSECEKAGVSIQLNIHIETIEKTTAQCFSLRTSQGSMDCESLVIATGGLSFPTMGAGPFGYKVAQQFSLNVWPTNAGLVPFTLHTDDKARFAPLSGIAVESIVESPSQNFRENILFTHRGLSGPAILQISSYWKPGERVVIDLLPDISLYESLCATKQRHPNRKIITALSEHLPKRLVATFIDPDIAEKTMLMLNNKTLQEIAIQFKQWTIKPNATEGYRTAEVTLGGVDCNELSSKTMECQTVPGLYFVGEVLDVTGWLGGYNFQWAWSSGWCAGQHV